jgi:hypothetical protein
LSTISFRTFGRVEATTSPITVVTAEYEVCPIALS